MLGQRCLTQLGKKTSKNGWTNSHTCTTMEILFLAMKTTYSLAFGHFGCIWPILGYFGCRRPFVDGFGYLWPFLKCFWLLVGWVWLLLASVIAFYDQMPIWPFFKCFWLPLGCFGPRPLLVVFSRFRPLSIYFGNFWHFWLLLATFDCFWGAKIARNSQKGQILTKKSGQECQKQ